MTRWLVATIVLTAAAGCTATTFTGEPHVPGGPAGCVQKCKSWGLDFVGMVAMGEYSDACVCERPDTRRLSMMDTTGAPGGGVAGVALQMERARQQQAAAAHR